MKRRKKWVLELSVIDNTTLLGYHKYYRTKVGVHLAKAFWTWVPGTVSCVIWRLR